MFADDGPDAVTARRESSHWLPKLNDFVAARDFVDGRVLAAFNQDESQEGIKRSAAHYKCNFLKINLQKTVALVYDPTGDTHVLGIQGATSSPWMAHP